MAASLFPYERGRMNVLERLDNTLKLGEDEAMLLEAVRKLSRQRIAPRAAAYDKSGEFPWDNIRDINALGLNSMFVPVEYGGTGLSYSAYLACAREISMADASTGIAWATNFHATSPLVDFANDEQKKRWLPGISEGDIVALALTEPSAGSDATGMKTRFRVEGDEIIINGSKIFITNGSVCDVLVLFGKWEGLGDGKDAISIVVVEKGAPGFIVLRTKEKIGHVQFQHCRVVV